MKITQFEQSGIILETEKGFKLAVDVGHYTPEGKFERMTVDAILVSHLHADHLSAPQIKALNPKKVYLSRECMEALGEEKLGMEIVEIKSG